MGNIQTQSLMKTKVEIFLGIKCKLSLKSIPSNELIDTEITDASLLFTTL